MHVNAPAGLIVQVADAAGAVVHHHLAERPARGCVPAGTVRDHDVREAQELAYLSASIHADVDRVNRGLLSKDLVDKLKRVEKLSKQLRGELTR